MAMTSKSKSPEMVTDSSVADYYRKKSNLFIEEGTQEIGYRYDQVKGRKFRKPDGKEFTNNITLSPPSSEVLTLMKHNGKWYLVFGKQTRSPYLVDVCGETYAKVFIEQAAGLLERGQSFEEAAIAEAEQELGARLSYLGILVKKVCRHVSYADETSRVFLAIAESLGDQHLDENENITKVIVPIFEAKKEFESYLDGRKKSFFGYAVPDLTILAMERFFWKLDTGELDLDNLQGNLLK